MKKLRYFLVLCGLTIVASISAQSITPDKLKGIRSLVYNWVDSYLEYSYLSSEYDVKKYRSLFANEQISVVNDYLPITEDERIAIVEYTELYLDPTNVYIAYPQTHESYIVLHNEKITAKSYACELAIPKSISFSDEEKRYEYPRKEYTLYVTLEYDFKIKKMLCTDIYTSDKLSVEYILHQETDSVANTYINKTDTVELLDNKEQTPVIVSKFIYHHEFDDKMVEVRRDTAKNNFHIGATVGTSFYSHSFKNDEFTNHSQDISLSAGVNVGLYHQCFLKGNNRFGIEYGVSIYRNAFSIYGEYKTQYASIDPDGGQYLRIINGNNFHEKLNIVSLSIPLAFRYDYFIKPNLSIFGSLGAYVSYDLLQKSQVSVNSTYAGYYDWLFDLTIDQNGIYDFGCFQQNGSVYDISLNKFNVGVLMNIGCQYFIPRSNWSIEPSIRYQTSLYAPITSPSNFHLLERDGELHSATNLFNRIFKHNILFQLNANFHF